MVQLGPRVTGKAALVRPPVPLTASRPPTMQQAGHALWVKRTERKPLPEHTGTLARFRLGR